MLFFVEGPGAAIPETGRENLIVTLAVGESYFPVWQHLAQKTWQDYAEMCNADIVVVTKPLDLSEEAQARSVAWQKLLVLDQSWARQYRRVLWLDSDIIISPSAHDVFSAAPDPAKISLCRCGDRMSAGEKQVYLEHLYKVRFKADYTDAAWGDETKNLYVRNDVPEHDVMFNTGVMVLSPCHHNDLFLEVYQRNSPGRLYEQPWLSHEIIERNLAHVLPIRFNWGVHDTLILFTEQWMHDPKSLNFFVGLIVEQELLNAYFLHFYGSMNLMRMYMPDVSCPTAAA